MFDALNECLANMDWQLGISKIQWNKYLNEDNKCIAELCFSKFHCEYVKKKPDIIERICIHWLEQFSRLEIACALNKIQKNVCIHFLEHKVTNYFRIIVLILTRVWNINNNIIEWMFIQICCLKPPSAFIKWNCVQMTKCVYNLHFNSMNLYHLNVTKRKIFHPALWFT